MFELAQLLPGLYFLGVVLIGAEILRRGYDALPARVQAVFVLVVVLLFGDALFGGRVLLPLDSLRYSPPFQDLAPSDPPAFGLYGDQLEDFAPYFAEVRRLLSRGEWPLSNDLVGAGEPLLGNSQAQHFHPLMLLTYAFPLSAAFGLVAAFKVWMALAFGFLLLRRLGLGEEPALAGSLAYGLGGFMLLYLGWPQTQSAAALPLVLYAVECAVTRGRRRDWLLALLATVTLLLAGHPETMLYVAVLAGAWALVRSAMLARRRRAVVLARLAATALVAGLLVAPVALPAAAAARVSTRYAHLQARRANIEKFLDREERRAAELGTSAVERVVRRVLPIVAPNAFGNSLAGAYWGDSTILEDAGGFAGTAMALAALLACWPLRRGGRLPGERLMLAAAAASFVTVVQPPGLKRLFAALPVLGSSASYNRRLALVLCFAIAFLGACTLERWRRGHLGRTRVAGLALGLAALIVWAYVAHPRPIRPEQFSALRSRSLEIQLVVLVAAASLLLSRRKARAWGPWTLALLCGVEPPLVPRQARRRRASAALLPAEAEHPLSAAAARQQPHGGARPGVPVQRAGSLRHRGRAQRQSPAAPEAPSADQRRAGTGVGAPLRRARPSDLRPARRPLRRGGAWAEATAAAARGLLGQRMDLSPTTPATAALPARRLPRRDRADLAAGGAEHP